MSVLGDIFDDPIYFFKKKRSFRTGFAWMLAAMLIFISLNQLMIELGFVNYQRNGSPLNVILINYATLIAGYFIITAITCLPYRIVGGKNYKDLFTVVTYSLIPLMFLWIPHIIAQSIVIFLFSVLMTSGIAKFAGIKKKKALMVTIFFLLLVILTSPLVSNFILLFGNFNILPY